MQHAWVCASNACLWGIVLVLPGSMGCCVACVAQLLTLHASINARPQCFPLLISITSLDTRASLPFGSDFEQDRLARRIGATRCVAHVLGERSTEVFYRCETAVTVARNASHEARCSGRTSAVASISARISLVRVIISNIRFSLPVSYTRHMRAMGVHVDRAHESFHFSASRKLCSCGSLGCLQITNVALLPIIARLAQW